MHTDYKKYGALSTAYITKLPLNSVITVNALNNLKFSL